MRCCASRKLRHGGNTATTPGRLLDGRDYHSYQCRPRCAARAKRLRDHVAEDSWAVLRAGMTRREASGGPPNTTSVSPNPVHYQEITALMIHLRQERVGAVA